MLSATEEVLDSVPSSLDAAELTKLAKDDFILEDMRFLNNTLKGNIYILALSLTL